MKPTPSLAKQAERAVIMANGAASRHRACKVLYRKAVLLGALALVQEKRKTGGHVPAETVCILKAGI